MKYRAHAAAAAFRRDLNGLINGAVSVGYSPPCRAPQGYLREVELIKTDVFRAYDAIANFHECSLRDSAVYQINDRLVNVFNDVILEAGVIFWYNDAAFEIPNMKSYRKELWFNVPSRRAFINITPEVLECLKESGIQEGLLLCNAMHITASVFINDDEPGLHQDYDAWLERLASHEPVSRYRHNRTGEDNGDAHLKRQIMGREVVVAVTRGKPDFGPWEQIFYGEFDGRRKKRVLVKIIGE